MISLEQLRDLCARHWNPIGIPMENATWEAGRDDGRPLPADEYDRYLTHVQHLLSIDTPTAEIWSYLERVESEFMGISEPAGDKQAFIEAIRTAS